MSTLHIACLSQKGGVGKSTMARLMARTYASAGWSVKICDFNTNQLTSVDWVAARIRAEIQPEIEAQPYSSVKKLKGENADCLVIDGAPDSVQTSLEAAQIADLVIIPTGVTVDDLKPQLGFAQELAAKGVDREKIIFVLNQTADSEAAAREASLVIKKQGFDVATTELPFRAGFQTAQNRGYAISETTYPSLNERAESLAGELVTRINEKNEVAA